MHHIAMELTVSYNKVVFPKVLDNLTQQFSILTEAEQFSLGELCKSLLTKKEKETRGKIK